jgi:hypothetical protein
MSYALNTVSYLFKLMSSLIYSIYLSEVTTLVPVHVVHTLSTHFVAFLQVFPFIRLGLISDFKQALSNCNLCCVN